MSNQQLTPPGKIITGYKATDEKMKCRGHQFELGTWYEHDGDLSLCESGFHFCEYPSGPWAYYQIKGARLFKCEAEFVMVSKEPGADLKHVAKKIRLTEEIKITGNRNTGYSNTGGGNTGNRNTGSWNTGNRNTGYSNTGDLNTGNRNTGDLNTGNWNTGYRNTGDLNTGYKNTGDLNTGNWNTGNWNTGNRNTGNSNTGYRNTGYGNAGNNHSGFFNVGNAPFIVFGKEADQKNFDFELAYKLAGKLSSDEKFDYKEFLEIPNATLKKIKELHQEHIKLRKKMKDKK